MREKRPERRRGRPYPGTGPRSDRSDAAWIGGRRAVAEAVAAGLVREIRLADGSRPTPDLRAALAEAERAGVPVRWVARADVDRLAVPNQGVAAAVRLPQPLSERDLAAFPFEEDAVVVVLDGVEDPQNLGAAARSSDAAGAAMLVIRERRSAGLTAAAVRASAGALVHLPVARVVNISRAIEALKDRSFTVAGLDQDAPTSFLEQPCPSGSVAVVVGSEGAGLSRLVRDSCDVLVALPMRGKVGSLNAAASVAAALYAWVLPTRTR